MTTIRSSVALASVFLAACAAGCASDAPPPVAEIGLALALPKGLVDVDKVKLYVWDQADVPCKGAAIAVPVDSVKTVYELALAKCNGNKQWCGSGSLEKNAERVLTFYVEGRFEAKKGGFTGCVERAVDQDPLQIEMKAQPLIEGVKCGDAAVGYGETCDPGGGAGDEACDAAKCQTKEVLLSNGKATNRFFRGRPGRKTRVGSFWFGDKFYAAWSDAAVQGDGGDGPNEITVRRMGADLLTETTPLVLSQEVRLPAGTAGPNTSGGAQRGSTDTAPTMVPVAGGNLMTVMLRDDQAYAFVHDSKFNGITADAAVGTGGGQTDVHAAASAGGDAVIVYVQTNVVKSVIRKADGSYGAAQTISSAGTASGARVAWLGGEYVVVWSDGEDIKMRRLGADGAPKTPEAVVNTAKTAGKQDQPSIAAFDTGEFLVAWRDAAGDAGADIRLQKFDKTGAPTGTEAGQVINDVVKDGDQDQPSVAAGRTPGGVRFYAVVWRTTNNIGGRFVKVDEQGFLISHASATTSEFAAGLDARPRSSPVVTIGSTNPYVAIAWSDDTDIEFGGDDDRVRVRRFPMPDQPK